MSNPPADWEALYERAPCGLVTTLANGTIRRVNQTFCSFLGVSSEALVDKKRLQDLLTVGSKIFHQTHWMPLLQMQGSIAEVQIEFLHSDGRALPMLVNASVRPSDGVVFHDVAIFIVVDRRKYERELLYARRRAEELLERERIMQDQLAEALREQERQAQARAVLAEQLIGIVSHDLRTPLGVVLLGAAALEATGLPPAHVRIVKRIASATERANRLITDLLDFTQARLGGGLRAALAPIDLHALVADGIEELRLVWHGRMIEHVLRGEGSVNADADRLAQVLTNLVANAMTYGAAAHPITITSAVFAEGLSIAVHNHGPMIPEALMPHLFEPLRRGDHQVKLGSSSVGLGLYIVQAIAEAHGGKVSVESHAELGTTFTLYVPAH
jgi:sigma-B regulation protein RsbU (phosphoserine phosphatase)